jgi:hypothetical protein
MKCVKRTNGEILRIPDWLADKMVVSGDAVYIPKDTWKKEGRPNNQGFKRDPKKDRSYYEKKSPKRAKAKV